MQKKSMAGRKVSKLELFLGSGDILTFRHVEIIRDDELFIQFWYISAHDDMRYEAIFHKRMIAGVTWKGVADGE